MELNKEDKNVVFYSVCLLITLVLLLLALSINDRGKTVADSPKLLPLITIGIMAIISAIGLVEALVKKGKIKFRAIGEYLKNAIAKNKETLLSVAIVGVYIVCVLCISFYLSSFVLIAAISCLYVKKLKIWWSIAIAALIVVALYLIFAVGFNLYLR